MSMTIKSVHNKLEKVRAPRVHITYDVETEGAEIKKELPFIAGVVGDFSGDSIESVKPLKDRKFVQIDADNFDEVMQKIAPSIQIKVENLLQNDNSEMALELHFNSMDDFSPAKIVDQVEPLRKLLEVRNKLTDLAGKADRSTELENLLEKILNNNEQLQALSKELGV